MFCTALGSTGGASAGTASVVPGVAPAVAGVGNDGVAARILGRGEQLAEARRLDLLQAPLLLGRNARLRQRTGRRNGLALILRIEDRPAEIARQWRAQSRNARVVARESGQPSAVVRFSVV